jgi:hypothetical protein
LEIALSDILLGKYKRRIKEAEQGLSDAVTRLMKAREAWNARRVKLRLGPVVVHEELFTREELVAAVAVQNDRLKAEENGTSQLSLRLLERRDRRSLQHGCRLSLRVAVSQI